jgi:hypothetical protein
MMDTSFFLARQTLIASARPGMALWREKLFAWMLRNAESAMEFFKLPTNRVVEAGEAHRVDHGGRAGLAGEQLVVLVADGDADRSFGREVAGGERDQDRGVVAAGRDDHRPASAMRTACSVLSRVASASTTAQPSDSARSSASALGSITTMSWRRRAAGDQLVHRFRAAGAEAGDDRRGRTGFR